MFIFMLNRLIYWKLNSIYYYLVNNAFGRNKFLNIISNSRLLQNDFQQQLYLPTDSRHNKQLPIHPQKACKSISGCEVWKTRKYRNWQEWKWIRTIRSQAPLKCKNVQFAKILFQGLISGIFRHWDWQDLIINNLLFLGVTLEIILKTSKSITCVRHAEETFVTAPLSTATWGFMEKKLFSANFVTEAFSPNNL